MRTSTGLICILCESGLSYRRAAKLAESIDRLRIGSLSSDDIAGLLLSWANVRTAKALMLKEEQIRTLQGADDQPQLPFYPN